MPKGENVMVFPLMSAMEIAGNLGIDVNHYKSTCVIIYRLQRFWGFLRTLKNRRIEASGRDMG